MSCNKITLVKFSPPQVSGKVGKTISQAKNSNNYTYYYCLPLIYPHLSCAAKFEEHEERTVCMEQLQILAQCSELPDIYSKDEFLMMELYLLKFFDWSVSYPTASYFLEYFLSNDEEEEEEGGEEEYLVGLTHPHPPPLLQDREERRVQLERLTGCFLEASLRGI